MPQVQAEVLAHGGETALELAPSRAYPGQTVQLLGDDLQPGSTIRIELLTAGGVLELDEVQTDAEGHLRASIRLPADLPARVYEVRVVDVTGVSASAYVTVLANEAAPTGDLDSGNGLLVGLVVAVAIAALAVVVAAMRRTQQRARR
jgi:hypothetical protein